MSTPLRILHLEDDPADADLIEAMLEAEGLSCEVTRAATGGDFFKALGQGDFDLILADYALPSFNGISALSLARKRCPDVPFLFVSGSLGEELAVETLKGGATDYILKQRLTRLVPSVRRALRESTERLQRQQAEANLQQSELRWRRFIEANILGVAITNLNGAIVEANDKFLHLVGYTRDDLLAGHLRWDEMTPPEYAPLDQRAIVQLKESTLALAYEKEYIRKDGSRVPVLIGATLLEPAQGTCISYVVDLIEQKQAEYELLAAKLECERAGAALSALLARTGTELLTPTSTILECAQQLEADALTERQKENVQQILTAGKHLRGLVDNLLANASPATDTSLATDETARSS
ncbi:MAG TPA: response regulator [Abditibacteriaceae bacterium]|nr:response regulator [Abditibacteriaceae bacterium]